MGCGHGLKIWYREGALPISAVGCSNQIEKRVVLGDWQNGAVESIPCILRQSVGRITGYNPNFPDQGLIGCIRRRRIGKEWSIPGRENAEKRNEPPHHHRGLIIVCRVPGPASRTGVAFGSRVGVSRNVGRAQY